MDKLPYAPVPFALLLNIRLTATNKVIAGPILRWLLDRPTGQVYDATFAEEASGMRSSPTRPASEPGRAPEAWRDPAW